MIQETLHKIEERLAEAPNLSEESREKLESLLKDLRREINAMSDDQREQAESIAGFTEAGAREALRQSQNPDLLETSLEGLRQSVREFEASHPRLTHVVNGICQQLANLGI